MRIQPIKLPLSIKIFLFLIVGGFGLFFFGEYYVNFSESCAMGVWTLSREPFDYKNDKGKLVLFYPPNTSFFRDLRDKGYLKFHHRNNGLLPIGKRVIAGPGDIVDISDYVTINNQQLKNSDRLKVDSMNRPIPSKVLIGKYIIPEKKYWLQSSKTKGSYDSRYFGAVDISTIQGVLQPVWLWE